METEAESVFRVALAQVNLRVGDIDGNTRKIIRYVNEARERQADLVAFPELSVCGYPPEDLLLRSSFIRESQEAVARIVAKTKGIVAVVGFPYSGGRQQAGAGSSGDSVETSSCVPIFNAAAVACDGELVAVCKKILLPNYGVFDEKRYFTPGRNPVVFELLSRGPSASRAPKASSATRSAKGPRFGVNICEDIWSPAVAARQTQAGALVILNISCSPYHVGKGEERDAMLAARSTETGAAICYVNLIGGQDELVFDGESAIAGPGGRPIARAPQFEEALLVADIDVSEIARLRQAAGRSRAEARIVFPDAHVEGSMAAGTPVGRAQVVPIAHWCGPTAEGAGRGLPSRASARSRQAKKSSALVTPRLKPVEEVYRALVLGTHDYVVKNGFKKVAIGLSGGIDSSLVAAIASDALGAENVRGVMMPSRYTSKRSSDDAAALAKNLRVKTMTIPIEEVFGAYLKSLKPAFAGKKPGITEENIQARIRGSFLMALSNKFGWLVLTTGNKSEIAVGYSTLYGDTAGGFAVIRDVPKTMVYKLARFRNTLPPSGAIPRSVLTKAPTAELRPNQTDQDTLPPYEVLDSILEAYVERDSSCDEIVAQGFAQEVVSKVVAMVDASEYKRRQAPPGVKITPKAFGKDRRMPITNFYKARTR